MSYLTRSASLSTISLSVLSHIGSSSHRGLPFRYRSSHTNSSSHLYLTLSPSLSPVLIRLTQSHIKSSSPVVPHTFALAVSHFNISYSASTQVDGSSPSVIVHGSTKLPYDTPPPRCLRAWVDNWVCVRRMIHNLFVYFGSPFLSRVRFPDDSTVSTRC
jgi:hypothetical protein